METLSDRMKREARALGLCDQWYSEWKDNSSKDEMIDKFINGIDFCIEHDWPNVNEMKELFQDRMHDHGIYADEQVSLHNCTLSILNGGCRCEARYDGFGSGEIYVRHNSTLDIDVSGLSRVVIDVYDSAFVNVKCDGASKVYVYLYGGNASVSGNVIVRNRKDFLRHSK